MNAPVPSSEANAASKATAPVPVEIRYGDFHFSWWYVVVFVAMAWLALGVDPPFIPWIVPLMFAAVLFCAAEYTRERFRHAGPALTLDEKGLHWMPYEQGRLDVSWDEIEHLTWGSGGRGGDYVGIRLKHPEQRCPPVHSGCTAGDSRTCVFVPAGWDPRRKRSSC